MRNQNKRFNGVVAVVTGASAGIGRATALALAREGADLGLISRNRGRLEQAKKQIEALGRRAQIYALDVADADAVESAADDIEKALGPIELWVNNAMVSVFSPVHETTADEFRRVIEVTYLGYVHGTLTALRRMRARDRGVIVQVGSALAYRGIPLQAAYCAAKHAIQGFQDSLYAELIHDRSAVRTTMVQLPAHNTPQFDWAKSRLANKSQPLPPVFQPEIAAQAILWAARHPKREWLVGWPSIKAIWGNRVWPSFVDWYLAKTGYTGQQSDEPRGTNESGNLWHSLDGDFGAHGRFDAVAKSASLHLWLTTHRAVIAAVVCVVLIAAVIAVAF
jgi:short-subunit dehydrogenase